MHPLVRFAAERANRVRAGDEERFIEPRSSMC